MRVLEVFLLTVLGCSLAGGRLVSKCELKDQLMTAFSNLMMKAEKGHDVEDLVAKIVCHVELTSDFNTSAVNQLTPGMDDHHSRERREAGDRGRFGKGEREDDSGEEQEDKHPSKPKPKPTTRPTPSTHPTKPANPTPSTHPTTPINPTPSTHPTTPINPTPSTNNTNSTLPTTTILPTLTTNFSTSLNQSGVPSTTIRPRKRRDVRYRPSNTQPTPFNHHQKLDEEVWTLYGLFQLSTQLVCNDTTLSPNICGMDCNNLLDDDISDDISCLMTILNHPKGSRPPQWKALSKMIRLIFQHECSDQDASEYFAECA